MNKKTKQEEKTPEKPQKNPQNETWADDQNERKYYYDDAYGYEIYQEDDDEKDAQPNSRKTY